MSFLPSTFRAARIQSRSFSSTSRVMSVLTPVHTSNAPPAAAAYSQAIKVNGFIYVSGQVPLTPQGKMVEGEFPDRVERVFQNVKAILEEANSGISKIVKVNIFLTDMGRFAEFNQVYAKYFSEHKPARSCVAVRELPLGADVEVEAVAVEN